MSVINTSIGLRDFLKVPTAIYHVQQIRDLVSKFSYKPGTTIRFLEPHMHLTVNVPNANPSSFMQPHGESIGLTFSEQIPSEGFQNEGHFKRWMFDFVMGWERHEASEWLKFNNQHVVEPHPETKITATMNLQGASHVNNIDFSHLVGNGT